MPSGETIRIYIYIAILVVAPLLYLFGPGRARRLEQLFRAPEPLPAVDFALLKLGRRPNQYLVCPPGICRAAAHAEPPVFDMPPEALRDAMRAVALSQPDTVLARHDEAANQDDFIQRTRLMRYPDIITVRYLDDGGGKSTLAIYSRSVYGYSDRGVNRARVQSWLEQLAAR